MMEVVIGLFILYWVCWGTYHSIRATVGNIRNYVRQRRTARQSARSESEALRQEQAHRDAARRATQRQAVLRNRQLQVAILNLANGPDPDFRRAAAAARDAQVVPANFRRQQFHRLRPNLLRHYASCLQRGSDPVVVHASLVELVTAFGVPEFEADYIRQEVERTHEARSFSDGESATAQFQTRLTHLQRSHDQRMEVIRSLANLADDVRTQLLEAEERRFQEQLFGRNAG